MSSVMDSERLGAIVEEAKEYGHWDIVKRVSGKYTLFDGGRAVAEFGEAVYDARFILDAIHALPQLHQQVQDLQAQSEHLKLLFDCVIGKAPLPPIKGYSTAWHYSEDCYFYDADLAEMQGHICYEWQGEDDAPQVASYEGIAFFVVYGDDDKGTLAESVKAWKVKGGT